MSPLDQPLYCEKQEAGRAQDIAPETQIVRPEQSAHIGLPEHLMRKQLQSETDEEQPADDAGRRPEMSYPSVSLNRAVHKITHSLSSGLCIGLRNRSFDNAYLDDECVESARKTFLGLALIPTR